MTRNLAKNIEYLTSDINSINGQHDNVGLKYPTGIARRILIKVESGLPAKR